MEGYGGYQGLEPLGPDYQFNAEREGEGEVKDVAQDADMEEKVDGGITATGKAGREASLRGKVMSSILCWVQGDREVFMWTYLVDAGVWEPKKTVIVGIEMMAEAMGMDKIRQQLVSGDDR